MEHRSNVVLTILGYKTLYQKIWAFISMGVARRPLSCMSGLRFFKLMGSGDGLGFSAKPDFGRYALLSVWEKPDDFNCFLESSLFKSYQKHTYEIYHLHLSPIGSKGLWDGKNPFEDMEVAISDKEDNQPVAVITRATIRFRRLLEFWKYVPLTSDALANADGLIASIGIGEAPYFRQATFSIWNSNEDMRNFAYRSNIHKEVIHLTKKRNWYKEEMFVRFMIVGSSGTWKGKDPLKLK